MRIQRLILTAYGQCRDVGIDIGDGVTVVLGANEAGKSTSLDALHDLLWGIPRNTPRVSEFARPQLRIDALVAVDGGSRLVVRKSTGLFAEDLVTQIPAPWDPEDRLSAQWWRTRLGINHADLRSGGNAVFAGCGDLAEIIFAAREGRSAREVLNEITEQADKLFKPDGRAKKVQLRLAVANYQRAVTDRDARLTRASEVVAQRDVVAQLETKHRHRRDDVTATSQALKLQEENRRVIASVLTMRRASSELAAIDSEGDRLSTAELAEYDQATAALRIASDQITKLDNDIDAKAHAVDALSVDDRLLDDQVTLKRLQSDVKARIEDLRRAGEEFGPAVAEAESLLRQQLRSIGIEAVDDLDATVNAAMIRDDHAATLNDLADRLERLAQKRQDARDGRDRALGELLAKGVSVEMATSKAPDEKALNKLRKALSDARIQETTASRLLTEATDVVATMGSSAGSQAGAALTFAAVVEARGTRDAQWGTIRRSWVAGDLPPTPERVDIAAEFDKRMGDADRLADDEATERSRVAALNARTEVRVAGFEAAREKQRISKGKWERAAEDCHRIENEWGAVWADLGITAPDIDDAPAVTGLLTSAHSEHALDRSAAEQIAEINELWQVAAELVGLPAVMTTAAWRKRTEVLDDIETVQQQRVKNRVREAQARDKWDDFVAEALELLQRHGALEEGQQAGPAAIEQAVTKLSRQLDVAIAAEAKRGTYREQIDEMRAQRDGAQRSRQDAADALQRLAEVHSVGAVPELEVLADRARRAAEPLEQEREAKNAIRNGLSPGSDLAEVAERLAGHDEATVEREVEEAQLRDDEAREAAERILSDYTSARDRLIELEAAAGADEAEAAVVSRQSEVADLVETWAILVLQRKLLEDVLDGLRSSDTHPLLDHAGRLLEQLTGGRWVALRAEEDGVARKLRVIRTDNTRCDTSQLSEGTADQVFFALRLAAVAELHNERVRAGEAPLPLVLDDVLMAFDEVRVRSALQILTSLAPGLQIIVFTHHQHVAAAAAEFAQITVSCLPAAAPIADPLDGDLIRARAQRGAAVTTG